MLPSGALPTCDTPLSRPIEGILILVGSDLGKYLGLAFNASTGLLKVVAGSDILLAAVAWDQK